MDVKEIPLDEIRISALNTRKDLDAGTEDVGIDSLADSIREKGLVNPVTLRETRDGKYELIAGQRRLLAFRRLRRTSIPAVVRSNLDDADAAVLSLIENVQRADMHPLDKARAYDAIHTKYGSVSRVARETGVSQTTVQRYLKLLNLSPSNPRRDHDLRRRGWRRHAVEAGGHVRARRSSVCAGGAGRLQAGHPTGDSQAQRRRHGPPHGHSGSGHGRSVRCAQVLGRIVFRHAKGVDAAHQDGAD